MPNWWDHSKDERRAWRKEGRKSRSYLVCPCGGWVYEDRKKPYCSHCGQKVGGDKPSPPSSGKGVAPAGVGHSQDAASSGSGLVRPPAPAGVAANPPPPSPPGTPNASEWLLSGASKLKLQEVLASCSDGKDPSLRSFVERALLPFVQAAPEPPPKTPSTTRALGLARDERDKAEAAYRKSQQNRKALEVQLLEANSTEKTAKSHLEASQKKLLEVLDAVTSSLKQPKEELSPTDPGDGFPNSNGSAPAEGAEGVAEGLLPQQTKQDVPASGNNTPSLPSFPSSKRDSGTGTPGGPMEEDDADIKDARKRVEEAESELADQIKRRKMVIPTGAADASFATGVALTEHAPGSSLALAVLAAQQSAALAVSALAVPGALPGAADPLAGPPHV